MISKLLISNLLNSTAASSAYAGHQGFTECFKNPEPVSIQGLPDGFGGTPISTEEPFITRDGRFLFFNTGKNENNKDLHYAERDASKWLYKGEIGPGINNKKDVQGNPSMDSRNNFFYVNSGIKRMICKARFYPVDGALSSHMNFDGVPLRQVKLIAQKFHGNMGVEVSADGTTVYFSRATWDMNGVSLGGFLGSDILFSKKQGDTHVYNEAEAKRIMKHINTPDLEYAASISSDGLELFFTRLALKDIQPGKVRSMILRASRNSLSDPFNKPMVIEAIGRNYFVEGPAISADEKELYYHKLEGNKFRLYKVTRQNCR
jgi:hypothetical protein